MAKTQSKTRALSLTGLFVLIGVFGILSCAENLKVYQRTRSFHNGVPLPSVADDLLEMGRRRTVLYNSTSGMADTLEPAAKDSLLCYVGPPIQGERCYRVTLWKDSMHWDGDSLSHVWLRKH